MGKSVIIYVAISAVLLVVPLGLMMIVDPSDTQTDKSTQEAKQTEQPPGSNPDMRWTELNDWYINDSNSKSGVAGPIRQTYGEIGLRKPSVSDFAYGCVIARLSGYIHPKPPYMSYASTVSKFGYTERDEYDIGIAYILTELDGTRQRNWCNKIVELHNLDPWDGQQVPWSNE